MVNQLLFTPLFNTYFFGMQSFLSGSSPPEILERIQHTVPPSWINSCKIWPAVTAFSFTFVPVMYRSIFGGVIAIGWQTYLSLLNARAQEVEEVEHAHAHENQHENKHENKKRAVKRCTKVEGRDRRRVAA
ncbi:hypothetical protein CC78DRAFT_538138 [Lojkania enalia]|uniref:Uncharacterized protein n=1 Tax=Lojkania enalia TaxID=147567 RepID=A0A9P4JY65_9PLEO|nr:hypothetical protein CC78DRAFT_538138 [Didymosphaeria enalia]